MLGSWVSKKWGEETKGSKEINFDHPNAKTLEKENSNPLQCSCLEDTLTEEPGRP